MNFNRSLVAENSLANSLNCVLAHNLVPLDIFDQVYQNNTIDTKLAAWFNLLNTGLSEWIAELIEDYPKFRPLYEEFDNM